MSQSIPAAKTIIYAEPRPVSDLGECYFYHTMEIPGYGLVTGQWDLRAGFRQYTGEIEFRGKRVLEIGTASGFLCFSMERLGAEVVAYDLSENDSWDLVPFAHIDLEAGEADRHRGIREINNGFWLAHKAFASRARVVYGTAYDIPSAIGAVDISTFCSVLTHLRDPFLALANAARLTRDAILVTDVVSETPGSAPAPDLDAPPTMEFLPNFRTGEPLDAWWWLNPAIVVAFLGVLGFQDTHVSYHVQQSMWGEKSLFTVVGRRTIGEPLIG